MSLHKHLVKINRASQDTLALPVDKELDPDNWPNNAVSLLELFLSGGFWPAERAASVHKHVTSECPRCGGQVESAHHVWTCPVNRQITEYRVRDSQTLLVNANPNHVEYPCLWHRGMAHNRPDCGDAGAQQGAWLGLRRWQWRLGAWLSRSCAT